MNKLQSPPVIVGAGPAGMLAAQTLVRKGLRPVVLDENARHGGQIYRQPPAHFQRSPKALYGFESGKAGAVLQAMQDLLPHIDYRPNTLVWNAQAACLDLLHEGKTSVLPYGALLVATGWILAGSHGSFAMNPGAFVLTAASALLVWHNRIHLLWILAAGALAGVMGWV